jgi:hypothetical protein
MQPNSPTGVWRRRGPSTAESAHRPRTLLVVAGMIVIGWIWVSPPAVESSDAGAIQPAVEASVQQAYEREFGHRTNFPAIYNDAAARNCRGVSHLMTTAYLPETETTSTLLSMYMTHDGSAVIRRARASALTPAGTFRVLTVIIRHPQTIAASALESWAAAQAGVNREHAAFARRRGYARPIVAFDNTNVMLAAKAIDRPQDHNAVRVALQRAGHAAETGQVLIVIDIDPTASAGGFASREQNFVYVGNYSNWKQFLSIRDWDMIAATAYHHEFAHLWGWAHDWAPSCGSRGREYAPFIAPPILFGWEDLNGDGQADIVGPRA